MRGFPPLQLYKQLIRSVVPHVSHGDWLECVGFLLYAFMNNIKCECGHSKCESKNLPPKVNNGQMKQRNLLIVCEECINVNNILLYCTILKG